MAYYDIIDSPLGEVFVGGSDEGVHRIDFLSDDRDLGWFVDRLEREAGEPAQHDPEAAAPAVEELQRYFAGDQRDFDFPLAPRGTPFQLAVWEAERRVPAGAVTTYGEVASAIGHPTAVRAVGTATGKNPLSIVVPCHRVIGANGTLTGYASGLDRKRWLLRHEGAPVA